jgi:hypothetical protein
MQQHTIAPADPSVVYMQHSHVRKVASQFRALTLLICLLQHSLFSSFSLSLSFLSFCTILFIPFFSYSFSLNIETHFIHRLQLHECTVYVTKIHWELQMVSKNSIEVVVTCVSIFPGHWVRGLEKRAKELVK